MHVYKSFSIYTNNYSIHMTTWIDSGIKHSENELHLLGLDQTKLGPLILTYGPTVSQLDPSNI